MRPSVPKGTRDFLPEETSKRKYLFDKLEKIFRLYGYAPIETPAMENLSTLTGKYGEEGDQLLFKILNNGDYLSKADARALEKLDSKALISSISKRGLRYDLTVPFARYVVMHQNDLQFPFKRCQIQPVWRADRPQKGRYQEFYQCDVDIIGSVSMANEAELILIMDEVFRQIGIRVEIRINHRKILQGIAKSLNIDDFIWFASEIDKLDKIGKEKVMENFIQSQMNRENIQKLKDYLEIQSLENLKNLMGENAYGLTGIQELKEIEEYLELTSTQNEVHFDFKLARGLSYYTGTIFEVIAKDYEIGSLAGGGRYDDLTGVFGMKNVSGVGVSFGAERIFDVMQKLDLFPAQLDSSICVLVLSFDESSRKFGFNVVSQLRECNISADLYPDSVKMKKQLSYANARNIPYVIIIGSEEMQTGLLSLKDLRTGKQTKMTLQEIKANLLD